MSSISFGGDPENFMDPPRMENKGLAETIGAGAGGFLASILDLVGVHRQVAKGPKEGESSAADGAPKPVTKAAVVPQVLSDVSSALSPTESPIAPTGENSPMNSWGKRWIESLKPLTQVDPNSAMFQ